MLALRICGYAGATRVIVLSTVLRAQLRFPPWLGALIRLNALGCLNMTSTIFAYTLLTADECSATTIKFHVVPAIARQYQREESIFIPTEHGPYVTEFRRKR